jgi:hypothetical protein
VYYSAVVAEISPSEVEEELIRFNRFLEEFDQETDRAAVILGAANIDELLYQLLSATLLPSTAANDELLDGDGPLSTFSARINASHRLGLIDANMTRTLHVVRKIRNAFAHEVSGCTLASGAQADRVRQLTIPLRKYKEFARWRAISSKSHQGTSADMRTILAMLARRLEGASARATQVQGPGVSFIPSFWTLNSED